MTSTILAIVLFYATVAGHTYALLLYEEEEPDGRQRWIYRLGWAAIWPAILIRNAWRDWLWLRSDEA